MDREQYRLYLRGLTDEELRREARDRILEYRSLPLHSPTRLAAVDVAAVCWGECQDRNKDQIYHDALADARAEEAERRRINSLPSK